jgi:hypothetical protein
MPVSSESPIDFDAIAEEMRATVARWYNAEVEIVDPNMGEQQWDPYTNEYMGDPESIIWSGPARIQPIRDARTPDMVITQGGIQAIRVQVPYDAEIPLIRKGLQVRVTSGGEDAVLSTLQFVVRAAINSSYGWNRTIECDVDVRSVANDDPGGS